MDDRDLYAAFGREVAIDMKYAIDELISHGTAADETTHCAKIIAIHEGLCVEDNLPTLDQIVEEVENYNYSILQRMAIMQAVADGEDPPEGDTVFHLTDLWYEELYFEYFQGTHLYVSDILEDLGLATLVTCDIGYIMLGDAQVVLVPNMALTARDQSLVISGGGIYYD